MAQTQDDPVAVPVDFEGVGAAEGDTELHQQALLSINFDSNTKTSFSTYGIGTYNTHTTSNPTISPSMSTTYNTAFLKPGKDYYFSVSAGFLDSYEVDFDPPAGMRVYLNDVDSRRYNSTLASSGYAASATIKVRVESDQVSAAGVESGLRPGRVIWSVGVGSLKNGRPAGAISLREDGLTSSLFTPSSLIYDVDNSEVVKVTQNGVLRQVYAVQCLVDITTDDDHTFHLKYYTPSHVTGWDSTNNLYTTDGTSPLYDYVITNPDYPTMDKLRITKTTMQTPTATAYTTWTELRQLSTTQWRVIAWNDSTPGSAGLSYTDWTYANNELDELVVTNDSSGNTAQRVHNLYTAYNWGSELTTSTAGDDLSNPLVTTYSYYSDPSAPGNYKKLQWEIGPDGNWVKYDYYDDLPRRGQIHHIYKPYGNAPSDPGSASTTVGEVTTFDYVADWTGKARRLSSSITQVNGVTTAQTTIAYDETITIDGMPAVQATVTAYSSSSATMTTVSKTYREDADPANHFFPGLPHSVLHPDGIMEVDLYYRGIFNPDPAPNLAPTSSGTEWEHAHLIGTTNSSGNIAVASYTFGSSPTAQTIQTEPNFYVVPLKSTWTSDVHASDGSVIETESRIADSNVVWQLISRDLIAKDANFVFPNYDRRDYGDTTQTFYVYQNSWTNGRLASTTDQNGIVTQYAYADGLGRVTSTTRVGVGAIGTVTTTFGYDGANDVTSTTLSSSGTTETIVASATFDTAGRQTSATQPGPNGALTATYTYDPSSRQTTVTQPGNLTKTTTTNLDGTVAQVIGSAVVPEYYTYSVLSDGTHYACVNLGSSASVRKKEAWSDWLGRTYKTSHPGFASQPAVVEQSTYDPTTGRVTKTSQLDANGNRLYADTLLTYDVLGQVAQTAQDIDGNGTVDLGSMDRIVESSRYFENTNGAWWATTKTTTYPKANDATPLVSWSRTRLTGLGANYSAISGVSGQLAAEQWSIDADQNSADRVTIVNPSAVTSTIATTISGLTNPELQSFVDGMSTGITRYDGLSYTKTYDSLLRPWKTADPRTGSSQTTYFNGTSFVSYVQDAANVKVASYGYDSAGRLVAVTDANSKVKRLEYNSLGEVVHQWGDTVYPTESVYDGYGQRTELHTFQGGSWTGASWPGGTPTSITKWTYDEPSGLVSSKTDAANKAVSFAYNTRGQTQTRTWARGTTTTYGYDGNTGELLSQQYSDGTPTVSYTYTRTGQLNTVTDATGSRTFVYNSTDPLQLDAIDLNGFYANRVLTRQYDSVHRPDGFLLGDTSRGLAADLTQTYTYNSLGRFDHLDAASSAQADRTFTYGYTPNSALVGSMGVSGTGYNVVRGYEPNRNLLTSIDSQWNGTSQTKYDYTYNALAQRATSKQSGSVFGDFGGSTYYRTSYNDRGEVTDSADYQGEDPTSTSSPQLSDRHFAYAYDAIGNRQTASRSGSAGTAESYTTNNLNQYSSRTNPYVRTAGTVSSGTTNVSIAGGGLAWGTGRESRYWASDAPLSGSNPSVVPLTVTATIAGGGTGGADLVRTDTSHTAYAAAALQSFSYDADGNLTGDGIWSYNYDGENRLITMTTTSVAVSVGFPNRLLEFTYDYLGRRVQKHSQNTTTGANIYTRYLYDGNNLVAEFDAPSGSNCGTLQRSYAWGLDLVGSLSATGGVGALVQITDHTLGTSYLPTYDGNGNIASLLKASDGTIAASYEYSPFGELLRASVNPNLTQSEQTALASQPFRFSTKFTDTETGLVYYGARYYSPCLGRFVNRDPIEEAGGMNLYGFCANDGMNRVDVLGNSWLGDLWKKAKKALHRWDGWAGSHSLGATLLDGLAFAVDPILGAALAPSAEASRLRWTWHEAQRNPQVAAVIAAIATWYIGGWGAAAIYPAITAGETTVVAGTLAGAAGGFVGARASGADLSTSFRAAYQGAAWGGGLAFAGAELLGAKPPTSFSWGGAGNAFVTAEARYEVGRFAQNELGISGWEFDAGLLAFSYLGYKAFGDPYHDTAQGNHGVFSYIGGFGDRNANTGWFFKSGGLAHYMGEFMFDVNDQLLQWQGLPDAGGIARAYHGWALPQTGHSLGASRLVTMASLGLIDGGTAVALPFGEVAPGGVQTLIGTGDIIPGSYLGLGFNPDANMAPVPFITGHMLTQYVKAFPNL